MKALSKHPEVVCTELEEGAVLLHLETRAYYSLDRVGLDIWNLMDTVEDSAELADRLRRSYEAGEESAREVVDMFLERLRSEVLVVAAQPGDSGSPPSGSAGSDVRDETKGPLTAPVLSKHDEPLHEVPLHPFDPQLPLAE